MDCIWAEEGKIRFLVPATDPHHPFPPGSAPVFYNPRMELSRDATVLLSRLIGVSGYLDAMGATGVRGLRVSSECNIPVTIADRDHRAVALIRRNAGILGLPVEVLPSDANLLLSGRTFETVDIDPFGSPAPFIDSAIRGCGKFLFVTATDTAPLCGAHRNAGRRRYFASVLNTEYHAETGLRILLAFVVREAVKYDRGVEPLFCFSRDHYFRVHVRLVKGARDADRSLERIGYILQCPACIFRTETQGLLPPPSECPYCRKHLVPVGPLWTGTIQDPAIACSLESAVLSSGFSLSASLQKLVSLCRQELDLSFHYDYHHLARSFHTSPPPITQVLESIRREGYAASRAHYSGTALKTGAPLSILREAFGETGGK